MKSQDRNERPAPDNHTRVIFETISGPLLSNRAQINGSWLRWRSLPASDATSALSVDAAYLFCHMTTANRNHYYEQINNNEINDLQQFAQSNDSCAILQLNHDDYTNRGYLFEPLLFASPRHCLAVTNVLFAHPGMRKLQWWARFMMTCRTGATGTVLLALSDFAPVLNDETLFLTISIIIFIDW